MPKQILSTEEVIKRFQAKHGLEFDYSQIAYKGLKHKILIKHNTCGRLFDQRPERHMVGDKCPFCCITKQKTSKDFIDQSERVHGKDEFDYTNTIYKNMYTKLKLRHKCGHEFLVKPCNHIHNKSGCPKCNGGVSISQNDFIANAKSIHGDKYDYSNILYKSAFKKVELICNDCGNNFKQTANDHISKNAGCPKCCESKGEKFISSHLDSLGVKYIAQFRDKTCKYKKVLSFDFCLPDHNILIEYDGEQHFKPIDFYGGNDSFQDLKIKDAIKDCWAKHNNFKLIRVNYMNLLSFKSNLINDLNIESK